MQITTIEVSTEELFVIAKQFIRNGFSIYSFLFERYAQVRAIFAEIANSDGNFGRFQNYCDSMMTRSDAIQFLFEAGYFRV